jgi:hypothetical protein
VALLSNGLPNGSPEVDDDALSGHSGSGIGELVMSLSLALGWLCSLFVAG